MDPDVVAGWRLEGMDPDAVAGWRLEWIRMLLPNGNWDGLGCCCWMEIGSDGSGCSGLMDIGRDGCSC